MVEASEWVGRVIDGRYTVESILGSGGMGVVVRARHKFTGALVAVKMLRRDLDIDAQLEARFNAEARAPNAIGHHAIVKVLDAGRTPEGELYMVMELLAGQPMRLAVSRGLGAPTIRRVSLELLDALAAAHARGFVHRDLKPENVFLADPDATVKLLDFGIAKVLAHDLGAQARTAAGVVLGTLAYMAPEQLADASSVDLRADLWAMGVMFYEMLAGRLPYRANTVEDMFVMLAKQEPDPIRTWVPRIAPPIEAFLARALAKDPRMRFGSAIEMAGALAQLPLVSPAPPPIPARAPGGMMTAATGYAATSTGSLPPAQPAMSVSTTASKPSSMRNVGFVLGGIGTIVMIAAIVIATSGTSEPRHSEPPAPAPAPAPAPRPEPTLPAVDLSKIDPPKPAPATIQHHTRPPAPAPAPSPPTPAPATPPPEPTGDACERGCAFAKTCQLVAPTCVSDCRQNHITGDCFTKYPADCNGFAQCALVPICGKVGTGTGSCAQAWACQTTCTPGDITCGCNCEANLRYSSVARLFAVDVCLAVCGYRQPCMQNSCGGYINRCMADVR